MHGFSLLAAIATAGMALAAPALAGGQRHHSAADPLVASVSENDMLSARSDGFGRLSADDPREAPPAAYPIVIAPQLGVPDAANPTFGAASAPATDNVPAGPIYASPRGYYPAKAWQR